MLLLLFVLVLVLVGRTVSVVLVLVVRRDVPYLSCMPFVPSPVRRTAVARRLRRGGATTTLRLPNVSHHLISPSMTIGNSRSRYGGDNVRSHSRSVRY
ncbi:hypothetical protein ACFYZI_01825 [Streptomyces griseorubiginosus]|uniref:hypothetical protein n=1 Tax=Streptomyces griseorubiginosus TaxID=67304 RepID=UPI0036BC6954